MNFEEADVIRRALQQMPRAGAASIGSPPQPEEMYVLDAHAAAIDPDVSLVVGNRGMGKTFWATALLDDATRKVAAKRFRRNSSADLANVEVKFGFSNREGVLGISSKDIQENLQVPHEDFWRGVILHVMSGTFGRPLALSSAIALVRTRPDDARLTLRKYDDILSADKRKFIILFDQLDQMEDDWPTIQRLSKALLRTALAMKSYRSIRTKIFMRTDQYSDPDLFDFPDASKVYGETIKLRWFSTDLYGLMYSWLWRNEPAKNALSSILGRQKINQLVYKSEIKMPVSLESNPEVQGCLFDEIAGEKMGGGSKRGRPYSWIPTHLMDGQGEISPRSFMHALAVAAERVPESSQHLAIDHLRIQEGVSSASGSRRLELYEDYPWIREALEPLRDMTVPVRRTELTKRWLEAGTAEYVLAKHKDAKAPLELVTALDSPSARATALERALEQVGVLQQREDNKVNIPDIFRIAVGIKRMGGVKPQARKRI